MNAGDSEDVWRYFDSLRGRGWNWSADEILEELEKAQEQGIHADLRQWLQFVNRATWKSGDFVPPDIVLDFVSAFFASRGQRRVLDPFAGAGLLLHELAARGELDAGVGIIQSPDNLKLAEAPGHASLTWLVGGADQTLPLVDGSFDAVVTMTPLGTPRDRRTFDAEPEPVEVADERAYLTVLRALERLAPDGEAVFLAADGFFFRSGRTAWRSLPALGLYPAAVLGLPPRTLMATGIAANLVVVGREPTRDLFIGQLDPQGSVEALVSNMHARRDGALPELGRLVPREGFRGVRRAFVEERVADWAKREGLEPIRLGDITTSIARFDKKSGFPSAENVVYLATMGAPKRGAATLLEQLTAQPARCLQLALKPELANADYVAAFFNTPRGQALRSSWSVGAAQQEIRRAGIEDQIIYLPAPNEQDERVRLDETLRSLTARLDEMQTALWDSPDRLPELKREIAVFLEEEGPWIEQLPFPLASILWRYYAEIEKKEKVEHLLHFFEALAMFTTALFLSGFQSDPQLFEEHRSRWFANVRLELANFGTWTTLSSRIAATLHGMLSSERPLCLDLFRLTRSELLDALAGEDFQQLLNNVRVHRNDWSGHGGVTSQREHERRLVVLEGDLTKLRKLIGSGFQGLDLMRPRVNRFRNGVYYFTVQSLVGKHRSLGG